MSKASNKGQHAAVNTQLNWAHFIAGQAGVVPLSIGIPGVGKTATHFALGKATGRHVQPYLLDQLVPEDLGGYPTVHEFQHDGQVHTCMKRCPDERLIRSILQPSIVLVDEVTNVGKTLQAAALQLLNEGLGRFLASLAGDSSLYNADNTWIFAAANPVDQAAAGVDLSPPFVNRLCILKWETDRRSILQGFHDGFDFPEPNVPVLPAGWKDLFPKWGRLLESFFNTLPSLLENFPKDVNDAVNPFPTPRSWTNAGRLLAACESVDANQETLAACVYGCVGEAAGAQFFTWLNEQELPDPEQLLKDPRSIQLPQRGDLAIAILASVLNRVRLECTVPRWEAARELLSVAAEQQAEIARTAEGALWTIKPANHDPSKPDSRPKRKVAEAV
jgi:hypothetical protein